MPRGRGTTFKVSVVRTGGRDLRKKVVDKADGIIYNIIVRK